MKNVQVMSLDVADARRNGPSRTRLLAALVVGLALVAGVAHAGVSTTSGPNGLIVYAAELGPTSTSSSRSGRTAAAARSSRTDPAPH